MAEAAPPPLRDLALAAVGASLQLASRGAAGVVAGTLVPPLVSLAMRLDERAHARRLEQVNTTLEMAAARAGCADDLKAFEELLDRDQGHAELMARVLQASACAVTAQEKINALGRVLADGLQGPDKLDEALLLAAALNDLERPHVQVLSATAKSGAPITRRSGASSGGGRDSRTPGAGPPCPSSPRRPAAISWWPA